MREKFHFYTTEQLKNFCESFKAADLAKSDIAYDAKLDSLGIGIKTFTLEKKAKQEKIAEFNAHSKELNKLDKRELLLKLAELRNERIDFANRTYESLKGYITV